MKCEKNKRGRLSSLPTEASFVKDPSGQAQKEAIGVGLLNGSYKKLCGINDLMIKRRCDNNSRTVLTPVFE